MINDVPAVEVPFDLGESGFMFAIPVIDERIGRYEVKYISWEPGTDGDKRLLEMVPC